MKTLLSAREITGVWLLGDVLLVYVLVDGEELYGVLVDGLVAVSVTTSTISSVIDTINAWDVGLL
jgi:hypothetical protein